MNEKARAEQLIAEARQAVEEQAGLDRVRPLIGDLQQLVHALPGSASRPAAGSAPNGGGDGGARRERAKTTRWSMQSSPASEHEQRRPPEPRTTRATVPGPSSTKLDDRYKRALADLDNYRKRSARRAERRVARRARPLLRDWLEAVDSVERRST